MTPNEQNFRELIKFILDQNIRLKNECVDIKSGDIHKLLGGHPGPNHRMRSCCEVMYDFAKEYKHKVLYSPKKGFGASLVIRYYF